MGVGALLLIPCRGVQKGLCHGFYEIFGQPNLYLCRRKPKNNGPFLLNIAILEQ